MHGRIISAALTAALALAGPAVAQTIDQGPPRITTDATPTFTFDGEPGSTFECLIEPAGAWKSCSSPYSVQLPDGDYVFSVRARDGAGNVEPNPPRWSFTVDTSTVDTTIEGGPGDVTNDPTPSFTFATETTGATFECRIDGANSSVPAWASCSSPLEAPKLRSGAYTLQVRAKSPAGKLDTTPAQRAFTIDADAPDTTIVTGPGEGSKVSPVQRFEFGASEPGSTYECRIDNVSQEGVDTKTWEACAPLGQFTTPRLAGGQHTVEVRATDRAGNTDETPAKRSYTVEDCQPVVRFGVIEAIAPCLQNVGTEAQPVYESKDTVKVNGIPLPSIGGGKIVLTAPTPEKKGGTIAIQNAKLELAGIKLYEGGMAWDLPEGKLGEEKEFKKIDLSKAGQKLFGMKVEGHVALRLRAPAQEGGAYKSVLALHVALPEAFKSGPDSGSGSVTGDVAINIDSGGVHLDGLKIKVENAYIGKLGVKLVCLSFASAGSSAVEPCQAPAIGPGKPKPYMECRSDSNADRWDGALAIVLPTASKTQLGMWGGLRNGKLSHAGAYVDGLGTMVPLAPGVFLESVRLGVCLEPPPFQVKGGAAVSFGPSVDGKSAVRIDGDLHYSDAWQGTPWFIKANGSLSLFGKQVATSEFTYWGSGMIDFNFRGELDFGLASINGGVEGWIETRSPSRFNVEGWVSVCVYKIGCLDGRAVASSIGAAGCIKVTLLEVPVLVKDRDWKIWAPWRVHWEWQKVSVKGGAGYTWKNHDLDLMLSSCSIGKWILARPSQAGALPTIDVPADMPAFTARVYGSGGPPRVDLVGPDGRRITVPEDGGELVEGSHMIASDPGKRATSILVTGPAAGKWRIEPHAGVEVTSVDKAFATPQPTLVGGVGGKGHKRVLGYSYAPTPGQTITFVEKGPRTKRVLGVAKPGRCREAAGGVETERKTACGQLRFAPGAGPAGPRDIVAQIEQNGRPGEEIKVASYVAPAERRPAKPGLLRARRSGSSVLVRWAAVPGAASYNAVVTTSDGRKLSFAKQPVRVAGVGRDVTVRVAVRTVRLDGRVSKAARVRVKATRTANVAPHKAKPLKKKGGRR